MFWVLRYFEWSPEKFRHLSHFKNSIGLNNKYSFEKYWHYRGI